MISNLCFFLVILITAQICMSTQSTPATSAREGRNELRIVCYYDLIGGPVFKDYSDQIIEENLCTHIIYMDDVSFYKNMSIYVSHDGKRKFYDRIVDFRKNGIHVSINLANLNLYEDDKFIDAEELANAVDSIVEFMEKYNYDGFDFLWECVTCKSGTLSDVSYGKNANELMRQLSEAFKPRSWLLSVILTTNKTAIEASDIQKLSEYVDWMTVVPSDSSKTDTSLGAPLYSYLGNTSDEFNGNWSINYLIERGVPSHKLLLNVIFRSVLIRLISTGENAQAVYLPPRYGHGFHEICYILKESNLTIEHNTSRVGSYAQQYDHLIYYDDVEDVYRKAEYILQMNLGGSAIYHLDGEDFENKCNCGKSPLLTAMNQVLRNVDGPKNNNCT